MNNNINFVAIDFETANSKWSSACSIGYAIVENGEIIETGHHFIKPEPFYFQSRNIEIHGITGDDVNDKPNIVEVWNNIENLFKDKPIVSHNASFDIGVLRHGFDVFNKPYPSFKYLCTYRLAQVIWPNENNHRLNTLGKKFNIDFKHHDACEDAVVCAKLLLNMIKEYNVSNIDELLNKMNISYGVLNSVDYNPFSFEKKKVYSKHYVPSFLNIDNSIKILDKENLFTNKKVVVTGTFEKNSRSQTETYLRQLGATLVKSVSKNTDYLIVGGVGFTHNSEGKPGSKFLKATELKENGCKIEILSEDDFIQVLNSCSEKSEPVKLPTIDFDFEENAKSYDLDWALKYREDHASLENAILYLSLTDYSWELFDNTIELFGDKYKMKITFHDIRDNTIEVENISTGKKLKPFKKTTSEGLFKEIDKRIS